MSHKEYIYDDFIINNKIGEGSFASVYLSQDKHGNKFALKTEKKTDHESNLKKEYKIYVKLHKNGLKCIPKIYSYIKTSKNYIIVMELLKYSLENLFVKYDRKFKMGTVLKLGIEIISIMEKIHDAGFIHRDIKPDNFMIGFDKKSLYIMDFGLSKEYIKNGKHIPHETGRELIGTARYVSSFVNSSGITPSRRDDIISVGYMLIYFSLGKLPWQGLKKSKTKSSIDLIGDAKLYTKNSKLCQDLPYCFEKYLNYCYDLKFTETPDYDYLRKLFSDTAHEEKIKLEYEWR